MVYSGGTACNNRSPAPAGIHALFEEWTVFASGGCRPADRSTEADHIRVKGIAFPGRDEIAHRFKCLLRRRAMPNESQAVAYPMDMRVNGKNIPPQREEEHAGGGFLPHAVEARQSVHHLLIRHFSEAFEGIPSVAVPQALQHFLDPRGFLVCHPADAD